MACLPELLAEQPPWELQPGDSSRSHAAFRVYANLPPSQRSLAKAAQIVGKSHQQLLIWSSRDNWVVRAGEWDDEQDKVANEARLEAIKRISREEVEIAAMMSAEVRARIPTAAKSRERSPHALAAWAEAGAKLIRDGLAIRERFHCGRRPESARPARNERHSGPLDARPGAASPRSGVDVDRGQVTSSQWSAAHRHLCPVLSTPNRSGSSS